MKNISFKLLSLLTCIFTASHSLYALPATHAYLSVPSLKQLVKNEWASEIAQYQNIVDDVLEKETEYETTHQVFYHAQKCDFRILQDFLGAWYQFLQPATILHDFYFLRPWYELPQTIEANSFIDSYQKTLGYEHWNDHRPYLIKHMLSVNFSLFGSTRNYSNFGECTFKYFFKNRNIKAPPIADLISAVFDRFGFDKKYLPQLLKLGESTHTPEGSLLQIFVPNALVDTICYAAKRLGGPYRYDNITGVVFDHAKERYTSISPILSVYRNNPASIEPVLDRLQGRLLFSQDILLNPTSGVKIFRYTTVSASAQRHYDKKLQELCAKIFKKWPKRAQ